MDQLRFKKIYKKNEDVMGKANRMSSLEFVDQKMNEKYLKRKHIFLDFILLKKAIEQIHVIKQLKYSSHLYIQQIQKQLDEIETEDSDLGISASPKTASQQKIKIDYPEKISFAQNVVPQTKKPISEELKKEQKREKTAQQETKSYCLFVFIMVLLFLCQCWLVNYTVITQTDQQEIQLYIIL